MVRGRAEGGGGVVRLADERRAEGHGDDDGELGHHPDRHRIYPAQAEREQQLRAEAKIELPRARAIRPSRVLPGGDGERRGEQGPEDAELV